MQGRDIKNLSCNMEFILVANGKPYNICSTQQYQWLKEKTLYEVQKKIGKTKIDEKTLQIKLEEELKKESIATMEQVVSWMTPEERKNFDQQYRFMPVHKIWKG